MGSFFQPMRCPKCNALMMELIITGTGTNSGRCDCGYSYADDLSGDSTTEEDVKEFYDAPRPADDQEAAAWSEEWRKAHPKSEPPGIFGTIPGNN